jgi:DNA-binding GntR family transcriptional regulator
LESGDPVPKRSELVKKFGISDASVKSAFVDLVHEGYIAEFRAKGYFVLPPEERRVSVRAGHPEEAADTLRAALTEDQLAALIAALQGPSAEALPEAG